MHINQFMIIVVIAANIWLAQREGIGASMNYCEGSTEKRDSTWLE